MTLRLLERQQQQINLSVMLYLLMEYIMVYFGLRKISEVSKIGNI
jgi:hypothetical protein